MKTNVKFTRDKFIVNKEKKTVTCILDCDVDLYSRKFPSLMTDCKIWKKKCPKFNYGNFKVIGVAYCAKEDIFDKIKGRRIAESKAKKEGFKIAEEVYRLVYEANTKEIDKLKSLIIGCIDAERVEQYHINELGK